MTRGAAALDTWLIMLIELSQDKIGDAAPRSGEACVIMERLGHAAGIAAIGPVFGPGLAKKSEGLACSGGARVVPRVQPPSPVTGRASPAVRVGSVPHNPLRLTPAPLLAL